LYRLAPGDAEREARLDLIRRLLTPACRVGDTEPGLYRWTGDGVRL